MSRPTLQFVAFAICAALATAQPLPPASQADPRGFATIEGTAYGAAHQPLADTSVTLVGAATRVGNGTIASTYQATADSTGKFTFTNIPPGRYSIGASHAGYSGQDNLASVSRSLQNPAVGPLFDSDQPAVTVAAGQRLTGVEVTLQPFAVLSGKLSDENGDPLPGVIVRPMLAETILNGHLRLANAGAGVQTAPDGRYNLTVPSGRWFLSFTPPRQTPAEHADAADITGASEHAYTTAYFPGVSEMSLATGIDVSGRDIPGLNARLQQTRIYHVRGRLAGWDTAAASPDFRIVPARENGSAHPSIVDEGRPVRTDGTFDVTGLTPGSWKLIVCQYGKLESFGRLNVQITDRDLNEIVIQIQSPSELKGIFKTIGDSAASQALSAPPRPAPPPEPVPGQFVFYRGTGSFVTLTPLDPFLMTNAMTAQSNGSFTFKGIQAGRYRVDVSPPDGAYLKSATLDGRECLDSGIDLSSGAASSGILQITVSMSAAQITGNVTNPDGTPLTVALVTLVPDLPPTAIYRPDLWPIVATDATGHFTLKNIAPGTYRVYAWEHLNPISDASPTVEPIPFSDLTFPRLFDNIGALVTVAENDRKQVSLSLISRAKMDAASRGR